MFRRLQTNIAFIGIASAYHDIILSGVFNNRLKSPFVTQKIIWCIDKYDYTNATLTQLNILIFYKLHVYHPTAIVFQGLKNLDNTVFTYCNNRHNLFNEKATLLQSRFCDSFQAQTCSYRGGKICTSQKYEE